MPESPITFEHVKVLNASSMTMRCVVQGKVVVVGRMQILPGTTVRSDGDEGTLVMPRWAVHDLGLKEP